MTDSMAARLERVLTDNEQLQTSLNAAHGLLREVGGLLRGYERGHLAKAPPQPDKARRNGDMAARIEALLPRASRPGDLHEQAAPRIAAAFAEVFASAPAPVPAPRKKDNRGSLPYVWTEERTKLLDAEGHTIGERGQELLARVNALPGQACASVNSMRMKYRARLDAGLITPPARAAAKPAPAKPSTIPEEDKAEARQMIQQGRGARDLANWFGWDLQEAQDFAEAVRAEAKARAA